MKVSMTIFDPIRSGERAREAARLMLEALRILDEEGLPAAGYLAMALDELGVEAPMPRFVLSDIDGD